MEILFQLLLKGCTIEAAVVSLSLIHISVNGAVKRNEDTFALRFGRAGQTHGV